MKLNFYSVSVSYAKNSYRNLGKVLFIAALNLLVARTIGFAQTTQFSTPGTTTWTVPANVTSIKVECWGSGGAGGGAGAVNGAVGGGGGGGAYTTSSITVTPSTTYTISVGAGGAGASGANGGAGNTSWFNTSGSIAAVGGAGGVAGVTGLSTSTAAGGAAASCIPTTGAFSGGSGSAASGTLASGAGGGGAGSSGAGGNATTTTAGAGSAVGGGNGAAGINVTNTAGGTGNAAGGGGSGAVSNGTALAGGNGATGLVQITILNYKYTASGTWTAPAGINAAIVECWGGGGAGGGAIGGNSGGGGGGGGAYVKGTVPVTALSNYTVTVGAGGTGASGANGGNGGSSWFNTSSTVIAVGGAGGVYGATGALGALGAGGASASCIPSSGAFSGGNGAAASSSTASGAGGGGAGSTGAGGNATTTTAGTGTTVDGGNGAAGVVTGGANGTVGNNSGGGGSGATSSGSSQTGGAGAIGEVKITPLSNATYIWSSNSTTSTDFTVATNWTPNRTTPLTSDILVFQGGLSTYAGGLLLTVTNVPTQSIGALQLNNPSSDPPNVRLVGTSGNTLTIGTAANSTVVSGAKLDIGSNVNIITANTSTFNNAGTYTASGGGTTTINGLFNFTGAGQTAPAGITVSSTGELRFSGSGSPVLNAPSVSGTLTIAGTVTGITGTSPTYASTSALQYTSGSATTGAEIPSSSTVHDLIINSSGTITLGGNATVNGTTNGLKWIAGVLNIGAGNTLTIAGVTTGGSAAKTLTGTSTSTLKFLSSLAGNVGTVYFSGTAPQLGTLIMNLSGASGSATIGSTVSVASAITLTNGILSVSAQLTYMGSAANLSPGSATSYISPLSPSQSFQAFALTSGTPATLTAGPYLIPIGANTTSTPNVVGYRPVTLNFTTPPAGASVKLGFFSEDGQGLSATDLPTAGNNRAGYLMNIVTSSAFFTTLSGVSMSYQDADFNAGAPAITNVTVAEYSSSAGTYIGPYQSGNSSAGSLRTITCNNIAITSGGNNTLVLATPGANVTVHGTFVWTGNDFSSQWNDAGNWSGPAGFSTYPGLNNGDTAIINAPGAVFDSLPIITAAFTPIIAALQVSGSGDSVTLAANSHLTLVGQLSSSVSLTTGGTISANPTSTIEYADASLEVCSPFGCTCSSNSQIIATGFTYGNLLLTHNANPSATATCKKLNGSLSIAGNLIDSAAVNFYINSGTTTVSGSISTFVSALGYGGGIINGGSGNVVMNGGAGVTLNCHGGSMSTPLTISGAVAVSGNSTVNNTVTVNSGVFVTINNGITFYLSSHFINNGTIQSNVLDGGTIAFSSSSNYDIIIPMGTGVTGTFNATPGNRIGVSVAPVSNTPATVVSNTTVSNLSIYNVYSGNGLTVNSGDTLIVTGNLYNNGSVGGVVGPGTIQFLSSVNVPSGTGTGGTFDNTINLVVGNGSTTNTVTANSAFTSNNITVNAGATMSATAAVTAYGTTTVNLGGVLSVASGILYSESTNLVCNGTIQDVTSGGGFAMASTSPATIDGGTSLNHGQITVSSFNISSPTTATLRTFNSTAFLDFGASNTIVNDFYANSTITNNGTVTINGQTYDISIYAPLTLNNSTGATLTIAGTWNLNGYSVSSGKLINNSGTINTASIQTNTTGWTITNNAGGVINNSNTMSLSNAIVNNNGTIHATGTGGITSGLPAATWNNNANSSLDVAGPFFEAFSPTVNATATGNTITYDATAVGQLIFNTNYYNLVISGTGRTGNVTLQSATIGVAGNLTASATFSSGGYVNTGNTVNFNGSVAQTSSTASPFTFNNFQFSNSNGGVSLLTNATANNNLTFSTAGQIATGANTLIITNPTPLTAIGGANGTHYVNGNLQFALPAGSTTALVYPIGTASVYAPATLDITGVSGAVNITGATITGAEPNENNPITNASGIDQTQKCANYWTMIESGGGTFGTYDATFDFTNTSNTGTTANYTIRKFDSPSTWSATNGTVTGTTVQATGLTNFSEYEVGVAKQLGMGACSSTNVTCGGGSNGTATAGAVSGATGTVHYLWSNSATTAGITGLGAGTYTLTVSDNFNSVTCSQTVTTPAVLDPSASNNSPACQTTNVSLGSSVGGGTPGYTYSWSGPAGYSSTNANDVVSNVSPANGGVYTLVVTDAHGCTATTTTTVTVNLCPAILNLNLYIQGYYLGSGQMNPAMLEEAVAGATSTQTDTITVELRDPLSPSSIVQSVKAILNTNGSAVATFGSSAVGNTYWIAIKHRNAIQTWSAATMALGLTNSYDFTSTAASAYGSNMVLVDHSPNRWAFYSGDINQDENIDLLDFPPLDAGINTGLFGYYATDLNGDGNTDLLDFPVLDTNIGLGVFSYHP